MLTRDQHDDVVAGLYRAAMGELEWTAALARLADAFGSSSSICQVADAGFNTILRENHGYSRQFAEDYFASEAFARNPRMAYFYAVEPGTVYYDSALYDVAAMDRDPWAQRNVEILGLKYQLGTIVRLPGDQRGTLTVLRTPTEGHASEAEIAAFTRLIPHTEQALALGHLLGHRAVTQYALAEALARQADGVIVLNRGGALSFVNDAARAILAAGDGLRLANGALETQRAAETRRLHGLIAAAGSLARGSDLPPGGRMLVTRASGRNPLSLQVLPAPPTGSFLDGWAASCVIVLHDLAAAPLPARETLSELFGLTPREADLAVELVRHAELDAAATAAHMAFNTARVHLHAIFHKCGVSSQAQAVLLFSRLR